MKYSPRFQIQPTAEQRQLLDWTRDTVRQTYNHALYRFNQIDKSVGTLKQRVRKVRDELPDLKNWWTDLTQVYSTVLQQAVERIEQNIKSLGALKDRGYNVGSLNWKAPRDFRSFTYRQRGFELDKKSGSDGRAILTLKKVRGETLEIPVRMHRDLPDHDAIKHVTVKKEPTGAWFVSFCIETDKPDKPDVDAIDPKDIVGIDLGILKLIHDSDGRSVERLDLSDDRDRLEREQRALSRKDKGSNNWEKQRQKVAEIHERMSDKKRDLKHKLAHFYTTRYDAVFLEDLNVKSMLESPQNARNKTEVGWRDLIQIFQHHGEKHGCYVVKVDPRGTSKECAACGVESAKPVWVREHSCPACGYTADRDENASLVIQKRGLEELGVGHSELTPAETATATLTTFTQSGGTVSASRVVETGSPTLKESASADE